MQRLLCLTRCGSVFNFFIGEGDWLITSGRFRTFILDKSCITVCINVPAVMISSEIHLPVTTQIQTQIPTYHKWVSHWSEVNTLLQLRMTMTRDSWLSYIAWLMTHDYQIAGSWSYKFTSSQFYYSSTVLHWSPVREMETLTKTYNPSKIALNFNASCACSVNMTLSLMIYN